MNDELNKAFLEAVSNQVLAALEGPQRDAILAKGVAHALSGYEMKNAFAKLVQDRAAIIAAEVIASGAYDAQIRDAIQSSFAALVEKVPAAATEAIKLALFGKKHSGGSYDNSKPGLILEGLK